MQKRQNVPSVVQEEKKVYLINCKLANYLIAQNVQPNMQENLEVLPKRQTHITFSLLSTSDVKLSCWDVAVMDAVYTLFIWGETTITANKIIKVLAGRSIDTTRQKRESIEATIAKLTEIEIMIDYTEEMRVRCKDCKIENIRKSSKLLPLELCDNQIQEKHYHVIDKSALYAYAEDINQIIAVPTQRFTQIPGRSETKELILLRRALIKRIELLQNKKNKVVSSKINYVHFFSVLLGCKENQSINWRKQKSKYHLMVLDILQRFVDDGYINNYQVVKDNNRISGVKIF